MLNLKTVVEMYYDDNMSLSAIAEQLDTYPKKIERLLKKHNYKLRNKKESQRVAMEEGRLIHKKGFTRSEEQKLAISKGMESKWKSKTKEEKDAFRKKIKEHWDNRSEEATESFREAAKEALRKASTEGSKLEKALADALSGAGYVPLVHQTHAISDSKMHIDILLEDDLVAIEVDGPFHRQQIWEDQDISRSKRADRKKNALLQDLGYRVIRVKQNSQLTNLLKHRLCTETLELVEKLSSNINLTGVFEIDE